MAKTPDPARDLAALVALIRSPGVTLKDVRLAVGPSDEDNARAIDRLARLDRFWTAYGPRESAWPPHARQRAAQLQDEQNAFERDWA